MTAPFGIALGSTPNDSNVVYTVVFSSIPKSHPKFPLVLGRWTPGTGLCEITGYSRWYESGPYTLAMRSEFENIKNNLTMIYGDYSEADDCHLAGACLNHLETMNLPGEIEFIRCIEWSADSGAELPDDLDHILLMIQATSDTDARICLTYASVREDLSLGDVL